MDRLRELVRLHRMGTGAREVARLLGMGPNTERAYRAALVAGGVLEGPADEVPELDALKALVLLREVVDGDRGRDERAGCREGMLQAARSPAASRMLARHAA
ncbi:hypothetical protein HUW62_46010 [Myxococcus sp. AM011]|uniref:hypothetical protein n=1 Tax=Myxococcus sp. AM011 TaxID=2745200 RepID=UPI001595D514|nr:hypothetical protein [Myxococcus sp. AM011]NVJ28576.1 hypothetical protein [Myxococcus sp. AM011]